MNIYSHYLLDEVSIQANGTYLTVTWSLSPCIQVIARTFDVLDHHGGNAPIDVDDGLTSTKARFSQQVNWASCQWIDGNEIVAISYLLYASRFHKLVQSMNLDA